MRSKANHDQWQTKLVCPQLILDGAIDLETNLMAVQKALGLTEADK